MRGANIFGEHFFNLLVMMFSNNGTSFDRFS